MKKTILIAFELDDHETSENLDQTATKFFQSLVLDKIRWNNVSITPVIVDQSELTQLTQPNTRLENV